MDSNTEVNEMDQEAAGQWTKAKVLTVAGICFCLGLPMGYLARGSAPAAEAPMPAVVVEKAAETATPAMAVAQPDMPAPDRMKRMADKSAAPLLEQLKKDPKNAALLAQIGRTYYAAELMPEAISYYQRAVQADPKHVGNRADLASYLYYYGKVDEALASLEEALRYEANNPQVLFNLGMMRWKGKGDSEAAVAAWTKLLQGNPSLPDGRRKAVEQAIANAKGTAIAGK